MCRVVQDTAPALNDAYGGMRPHLTTSLSLVQIQLSQLGGLLNGKLRS